MSYQANPAQDENIRQRLRAILNEKIKDRTYKGESFIGGRKRATKRRTTRKTAKRKTGARRGRKPTVCYGFGEMEEMMGGVRGKNPKKVRAGKRGSTKNPWLKFYKAYVRNNKKSLAGMSGKEIAKKAAKDYAICKRRYA